MILLRLSLGSYNESDDSSDSLVFGKSLTRTAASGGVSLHGIALQVQLRQIWPAPCGSQIQSRFSDLGPQWTNIFVRGKLKSVK